LRGFTRMRPSEALERHRDQVREIIARYPVGNPGIFGSAARGEDTEESDLDILVDRRGRLTLIDLARLEMELENLLGVKVDVRTPGEFGAVASRRIATDRIQL
jgi:predicted nucleotidyltransferase